MYTKVITAAALAALTQQTIAFNSHRLLHREADLNKRVLHVHTVVEHVTITVTAGAQPEPTENDFSAMEAVNNAQVPNQPYPAPVPPPQYAPPAQAPPAQHSTYQAPPPQAPAATTLQTVAAPTTQQPQSTQAEYDGPDSGSSTGSGAKRGIAYNDAAMARSFDEQCSECSWDYCWASSPGDGNFDGFVPMLWGPQDNHTAHWFEDADAAIANGCQYLLSFNEPDHADQANVSPEQAAVAHAEYLGKYVGQVQIGSPAVTNGGGDMGLNWLQRFMDSCKGIEGCHVDYIAVHWYSEAQYVDTLYSHISEASRIGGGVPVWLTEFATTSTDAQQREEFMREVIPRLDEMAEVERYAYFMPERDLMSGRSSLNALGDLYATL